MADSKKHTPGPWRWEINRKHKSVQLCGGLPAGTFDKTVLGFERYGMSGAAPVFHNWTEDGWGGSPKKTQDLAVAKVGREHHADWFALIDHPNAHLIAAAPELLEAAKEALRLFRYNVEDAADAVDFAADVEIKLEDAISKAEGRS
ncbi:hypothetical protein MRBLRH13_000223 [Agrobacterium radiobacter]|uniref:hypothetical protein n=1 Tax=Agrobacterium radiobacter TaxID=362 RepID=UPI00342E2C07